MINGHSYSPYNVAFVMDMKTPNNPSITKSTVVYPLHLQSSFTTGYITKGSVPLRTLDLSSNVVH